MMFLRRWLSCHNYFSAPASISLRRTHWGGDDTHTAIYEKDRMIYLRAHLVALKV